MICVHMTTAPTGGYPEAGPGAGAAAEPVTGFHGLIDAQSRHELIARAAFALAERRGFAPGHELDDWLAAEQQVEAILSCGAPQAFA